MFRHQLFILFALATLAYSQDRYRITPYAGLIRDYSIPSQSLQKHPYGLAVDGVGDVYIAEPFAGLVTEVTSSGIPIHVAGMVSTLVSPDAAGSGTTTETAVFGSPYYVAVDAASNVYISDAYTGTIRKVDSRLRTVSVFAGSTVGSFGDGGLATAARLTNPRGIAVDSAGNLYIAEKGNNRVRRVDASTGIITTVAGGGSEIG